MRTNNPAYKVKIDQVFGLTQNQPLTYVERAKVDKLFKNYVNSYGFVELHGGSKQGKSTLKKKYLGGPNNYVEIRCTSKQTIEELYKELLRKVGFVSISEVTKTLSNESSNDKQNKISIGNANIIGGQTQWGTASKAQETNVTKGLIEGIQLSNVNSIISALQSVNFNKFIILKTSTTCLRQPLGSLHLT